ncbi:MAG: hypothetical protein JO358_13255 [Alphaproteobacteria bacterium]|nr:hypothetical protein [Alphaproteobacteria bacterium]
MIARGFELVIFDCDGVLVDSGLIGGQTNEAAATRAIYEAKTGSVPVDLAWLNLTPMGRRDLRVLNWALEPSRSASDRRGMCRAGAAAPAMQKPPGKVQPIIRPRLSRPDQAASQTGTAPPLGPFVPMRWLTAAGIADLRPARIQVFEHFYFAIQAAIEGLGVVMGPLALVGDELREGRLGAPIRKPALRTRGYFVYAPERSNAVPAVIALEQWLVSAGSLAEAELSGYLSATSA